MKITLGTHQINLCSQPAFMGHEELAIPMLVLRSSKSSSSGGLGGFLHVLNDSFQPNDLSNTAVVGYLSGTSGDRVSLERMFVGRWGEWARVPEIAAALDELGSEYAFFLESSAAPLHDGFVRRCRLVSRARLPDIHPRLDCRTETEQACAARDALAAFLDEDSPKSAYEGIYGDYSNSHDFVNRFGDADQFSSGYAIWLEQEGILRAWTRIAYAPK